MNISLFTEFFKEKYICFMMQNNQAPTFFATKSALRKWFEKNHSSAKELLIGFYKVSSKKQSITWSESVDEAICFGWIDGVRKSIDGETYCIRFTPRKPGSIWSAINIKKVEMLSKQGLMHPSGLEAFSKRKENKSRIYSYEKAPAILPKEFENIFKSNKKAWQFFKTMPPSYCRTAIHLVVSAKKEETRLRRLKELIAASENERKIKSLSY
jgi:uncharacterized protein YdeI (YjbR/CyaY-like superfamily)